MLLITSTCFFKTGNLETKKPNVPKQESTSSEELSEEELRRIAAGHLISPGTPTSGKNISNENKQDKSSEVEAENKSSNVSLPVSEAEFVKSVSSSSSSNNSETPQESSSSKFLSPPKEYSSTLPRVFSPQPKEGKYYSSFVTPRLFGQQQSKSKTFSKITPPKW